LAPLFRKTVVRLGPSVGGRGLWPLPPPLGPPPLPAVAASAVCSRPFAPRSPGPGHVAPWARACFGLRVPAGRGPGSVRRWAPRSACRRGARPSLGRPFPPGWARCSAPGLARSVPSLSRAPIAGPLAAPPRFVGGPLRPWALPWRAWASALGPGPASLVALRAPPWPPLARLRAFGPCPRSSRAGATRPPPGAFFAAPCPRRVGLGTANRWGATLF